MDAVVADVKSEVASFLVPRTASWEDVFKNRYAILFGAESLLHVSSKPCLSPTHSKPLKFELLKGKILAVTYKKYFALVSFLVFSWNL